MDEDGDFSINKVNSQISMSIHFNRRKGNILMLPIFVIRFSQGLWVQHFFVNFVPSELCYSSKSNEAGIYLHLKNYK